MTPPDSLIDALAAVYADAATLGDPRTAHVVIDGREVVSRHAVPGVELRVDTSGEVLAAELVVARGARIEQPIHTCIGFLVPRAVQRIRIRVHVEPHAAAHVLAHCIFPNAERAEHTMDAAVEVAEHAELRYSEGHYHGPTGGIRVVPRLAVRVAEGARYSSDFSLLEGRAGRLQVAQRVEVAAGAVAEVVARVHGRGRDVIRVEDEMVLAGRASRGLIKTRIALAEDARAEVVGVTRGQAPGARGHMDCLEIVRDRAVARAEPIVDVSDPLAKVTHEAAVGTVDQDQLETLMAHGLTPEQAVDAIVTGVLR